MLETQGSGYGGHQKSGSTSGAAIIAAFVPTFVSAVIYLAIFVAIRNKFQKHYAPRTFLGTVPEKNRTPASSSTGTGWFHDFRKLPSRFVLTHSSLDAYLYLRFLKFIIAVCFLGSCLVLPVLIPVNATAGGRNATVTVCTSLSRCLTSSWQSCCASCLLARGEQGFASMVHTAKLQHSCCYLWVGTMQVLTHTRHVYNL